MFLWTLSLGTTNTHNLQNIFLAYKAKEAILYLREIPYEGKQPWQNSFYLSFKTEVISEEKLYLKIGTSIIAGFLKEEVGYMQFKDP